MAGMRRERATLTPARLLGSGYDSWRALVDRLILTRFGHASAGFLKSHARAILKSHARATGDQVLCSEKTAIMVSRDEIRARLSESD
jgi:hypothetical protein